MTALARTTVLATIVVLVAGPGAVPPAALADDQPPTGIVRLMAVGDVSLAWEVGKRIVRAGPSVPFAHVTSEFATADIVLANLECTVANTGSPWPSKSIHLRAPVAAADALPAGGVDAVNLANNHALDFGADAFRQELSLLDARAVGHFGGGANYASAHAPLIIERNGLRVAVLGYVLPFSSVPRFSTREWAAGTDRPGLALASPDAISADVAAARAVSDVVVVYLHSGTEYIHSPSRGQRLMAQAAVDAGASLVVESGPHVLQGYHAGDHTLIAYSLGNFVFDRFDGPANDSVVLDVTLSKAGVESFSWLPMVIEHGVPQPAVGHDSDRVLAQIRPL